MVLAGCLLSVWGAGCHTELPIQYETEHLRIGTDLEHPLCEGDLLALERIIETVEDELSLEMGRVTTVYVWDDDNWLSGPHKNCPSGESTLGCTHYPNPTIWTSTQALDHEIVHAVLGGRQLAPFFEEAIADVYAGRQTRFGNTAPSDNQGTDAASADLTTGRHFVRWLRERWGPEKLGELVRAGRSSFDEFESVYGISLEEADALYFEEAPYGYAAMFGCDGPELVRENDSGWAAEISLDCEAGEDTRVAGIGTIAHRTFTVTEPGYYTIVIEGDWFDIYRCSSEARIEEAPSLTDHLADAPVHHAGFPDGAYHQYPGPGTQDLFLEAGRHDIGVGVLGYDAAFARVMISPTLGPRRTTPG